MYMQRRSHLYLEPGDATFCMVFQLLAEQNNSPPFLPPTLLRRGEEKLKTEQFQIWYISVLPSQVAIYDEHWKERKTYVGPYYEKDTINLVCQAAGGNISEKCTYLIF